VDTTAPSITCAANKTAECGSSWTFDRPSASDNCDGTNVTISATTTTNALCGNTFSATRTWTATDTHGNTSSPCSQTVTVVDTVPPSIVCPASITNNCTSTNGAVVSFTVTASDTCTPNPTVVCVPASGSTFALCTTAVHCTATDACNNQSACSFNVTIKDSAGAPTLTIVRSGGNLVISWPATCTSYTLQKSTNLSAWSNSTTPVNAVGGNYQVTVAATTAHTFYRLIH